MPCEYSDHDGGSAEERLAPVGDGCGDMCDEPWARDLVEPEGPWEAAAAPWPLGMALGARRATAAMKEARLPTSAEEPGPP